MLVAVCLCLFSACAHLGVYKPHLPPDWLIEHEGNKKNTYVKVCEKKIKARCPKIYVEQNLLPVDHGKTINYFAKHYADDLRRLAHNNVKTKYSYFGNTKIAIIYSNLERLAFYSVIAIVRDKINYFVYSSGESDYKINKKTFMKFWKAKLNRLAVENP